MTGTPQLLLVHHLKTLKLPAFLREYDKLARTAVRGVQPALRARRHSGDLQPAVRRMDRDIRLGTSDRRIAGPAHPPCPYPGDERRELSSQPKPKTAKIPKTACLTVNAMVDPVGPQAPPALLRSA